MSFLLDTNILSEATKPSPDLRAKAWLALHRDQAFVSSITIGELRYGIELLEEGRRKSNLRTWLDQTRDDLNDRILGFDADVAEGWGRLRAKLKRQGIVAPAVDGQIAATAENHGLTVVTRNVADFALAGVSTLNPFETDR